MEPHLSPNAGSTEREMSAAPVLGPMLASAIASLRAKLGDPTAPLAIITPSAVNGTLARRELAFATSFIRVELWTPAELESALAEERLRQEGWVSEPAGWLRATVARVVREDVLPGGYHHVLRDPGWTAALVSALRALEGGRVTPAILSSIPLESGLHERACALGHLLSKVKEARLAENVAGPEELAAAALACIRRQAQGPANVARGAILLGDARLSRTTFEVLRAWLAARPVIRVDPAELRVLSPEVHGLTLAAPHAEAVALAARTPTLTLVESPDPTREMDEAVREVQAAILRGVALDRIAIVLPDPADASSLADALARADIPATWQTGPALAESPAARFLLHAMELALGEGSVVGWYDLLRQSELRLRAVLGEDGTRGRGRWRRLLSRSGAILGTPRILKEVGRLRLEEIAEETEEARASRHAAIDTLLKAIETLSEELTQLRGARSVGAHARLLHALLLRWWTPSPDQRLLARLLEGWSRSLRGPEIGLAELAATLRETLEATEMLAGSLKDASIRVLSPMQLLGAELEVVLVSGMTEGRFPARPREDPLLSDGILDAIHGVIAAGLFRSTDRVLLEKRRLASVRSAATSMLWLSAPAVEMLEGRPLLAGSLLLEVASQRERRRLGPSELRARMKRVGRRSRSWPRDPERALGGLESLLARLHGDEAGAREAALSALVDHALARRLLVAARAQGRLAEGDQDASLRAHAGFVDPSILSCRGLDGDPLTSSALIELIGTPERFFLRRVLGAWPPPRLREGWDPIAPWWVDATLLEESREVLERSENVAQRLGEAFARRTEEELTRAGVGDDDARARLGRMAQRAVAALMSTGPIPGPIHELTAAPLHPSLPWRLCGGDARILGPALHWVVADAPGPRSLPQARAALVEVAARGGAEAVAALTFYDLRGRRVEFDSEIAPALLAVLDEVRGATDLARAGFFPPLPPEPIVLRGWGVTGEGDA